MKGTRTMSILSLPAGDQRAALGIGALAHGKGAFLLPLLGAVQSARISLVVVLDRAASPSALKRALEQIRGPAVILLDGDDYQPSAPSDWRCTRAALAWARVALVHGAAGTREHSGLAVVAAALHGRLLLIHCASAEAQGWTEAAAAVKLNRLTIVPQRGPHPLPLRPEGTLQ